MGHEKMIRDCSPRSKSFDSPLHRKRDELERLLEIELPSPQRGQASPQNGTSVNFNTSVGGFCEAVTGSWQRVTNTSGESERQWRFGAMPPVQADEHSSFPPPPECQNPADESAEVGVEFDLIMEETVGESSSHASNPLFTMPSVPAPWFVGSQPSSAAIASVTDQTHIGGLVSCDEQQARDATQKPSMWATSSQGACGPRGHTPPRVASKPSMNVPVTGTNGSDSNLMRPRIYRHGFVPKNQNLAERYNTDQYTKSPITTLMIRNIPNRYTQHDLISELEELGFTGSFDFLYLPLDTGTMANVGYAFVNFIDPGWARRCEQKLQKYRFHRHQKASGKIAQVSVAHLQGLEANLAHYETAAVNTARVRQRRPVLMANISHSLGHTG